MTIHKKLLEFHKAFKGAEKTGFNPHFKSHYYTLDDLKAAIKAPLEKAGLYITHTPEPTDNGLVLWTAVLDTEGDQTRCGLPIPPCSNPQVLGSWLTYAERYNLMMLLFTGGELEDDGNIAAANMPDTVSDKTLIRLREYAEGNDDREKFLKKQEANGLTEQQGQKILDAWKEHDEAKD